MVFSCCKKKKKAEETGKVSLDEGPLYFKDFPFAEYETIVPAYECFIEIQMKNDEVSFHAKKHTFPYFTIVPSNKEGMADIKWARPLSDSRLNIMTWGMDTKLDKTEALIDVALRWLNSFFENSKCTCGTIDFLFNYDMTKNPEFIWSHPCFTSSKLNTIYKLSFLGNGSGSPFVYEVPEKFYDQFTKLEILELFSDVKVTESGLLSLKCVEIFFQCVELPEDTIYAFIKKWVEGKNAQPDFESFRFPAKKLKDSIVNNLKKNVDVGILWEEDEITAKIAGKIFAKREKDWQKDNPTAPLREVIKFDTKTTFQFVQKKSDNEKKPITATLCFKDGEGQFVTCGILDTDMDIKKNFGGKTMNYAQKANATATSHPDAIKVD